MKSMRLVILLALLPALSSATPDEVTDFAYSVDTLLDVPLDEIRAAETFSIDDLRDKDRKAVLARLAGLPKLKTLKFYGCDLSQVNASDPIPPKVKTVVISGGKVSQGTIGWLSKFPSGVEVVFGCDVRRLQFELGEFKWVTFDNCQVSKSAVVKLVENMTQVTFKEVELSGEGE